MSEEPQKNQQSQPPRTGTAILVGVFSWLVPGGGYFLLGQRGRAITVFTGIVTMFMCGIAIGGIRIMDPPGWDEYGYQSQIVWHPNGRNETGGTIGKSSLQDEGKGARELQDGDRVLGPAISQQPMAEIADKPWYVLQILCGPITLMASDISVSNAHPALDKNGNKIETPEGYTEAVPMSHSRSWELRALYTAVAGMLNLLAIIDATFIASQPKAAEEQSDKTKSQSP